MKKSGFLLKKQPLQQRSIFMVESIKEAATRILKDQGLDNFNTNAVAELAGVSIGSLYQYFGSKETLIAELKRDHFNELRGLFKQAQENLKTNSLTELTDAFIDASVQGHRIDPELHRILSQDLGHFELKEKDDTENSILGKVAQALNLYRDEFRENLNINTAAELIYHLVEKTVHDAILNEPDRAKQDATIIELKHMVTTYLCGPDR